MQLLQTLIQNSAKTFERDSHEWGLSLREALILFAIPFGIMLGMAALVPVPDLFVWITAEDSVMEWLQFFLIFAASLLYARLSLRLFQSQERVAGVLCLAIALGTFFVAGEEIAWGQHIFGWSTPEALETVNVQQETTLHNISGAHAIFVYAMMAAGFYGTALPLLRALWPGKERSSLRSLLIPPLCLVPAFFMPFGYRFSRLFLGVDALFPQFLFYITKFSEVTELCLYFGLLIFAWLNLHQSEVISSLTARHLFSGSEKDLTP